MKKAFTLIELSIVLVVIGILAVGIVQSSKLVRKSRLSAARSLTESSPVPAIKNLVLWLDSTAEGSFDVEEDVDGATVTNWYDVNPHASTKITYTQSSDTLKPIYTSNAINNLPALSFDGVGQYFELPYEPSLNPDMLTIFAVVETNITSSWQAIISSRNATGSARGYIFYFQPTSTAALWLGYGAAWTSNLNNFIINANKPIITSHRYNNTADSGRTMHSRLKAPGLSYSQTSTVPNAFIPNPDMNSRVGAGRNESTPTYYFNGYIAEIIIFNSPLSDKDFDAVEEYLGKKWGIPI